MRTQFLELSGRVFGDIRADEMLLLFLSAEQSDFVRFNRGRVRQAGSVEQRLLSLRLVSKQRQAAATVALAGTRDDLGLARRTVARLRDVLARLPEDPWLAVSRNPTSTSRERRGLLAPAEAIVRHVTAAAEGCDLVGFYAAGTVYRGFANSLGQTNWHETDSFNLDWSLYGESGKALKASYTGFEWEEAKFDEKLEAAAADLALLGRASRSIEPGEYRVYLAPRALEELTGLLCWGGFSAKARATRQSPLLRMEHGQSLSEKVTLTENTAEGVAPCFQGDGFLKPARVELISGGKIRDALVSPRSASEYGLVGNAANADESPESLDMAPGVLSSRDVVAALDTGLYVSDLWYLNFSDRPAGRITGMTRFGTFWVERGRTVAPVNAMRFDDSIYRMLGDSLVDLTRERELLLDPSTYDERSTGSARLPGALLGSLRFTL